MIKEGIKSKKGAILVENILFIVLNLMYITIITVFLVTYSGGNKLLEESYAKQIALVLDSAKPGMTVFLKMEDAFDIVKKGFGEGNWSNIVKINENIVTVKLGFGEKYLGYSYSFFNNISIVNYYIDPTEKAYVFKIGDYK